MSKQNKWIVRIFFYLYFLWLFLFVQNTYQFLLLNTFLAYVPIELSFHFSKLQNKNSLALLFLTLAWLLFYPNAPYLLTDLFHLSMLFPYDPITGLMRYDLTMWLYFTYLVTSVLACTILGYWSLDQAVKNLQQKFNWHFFGSYSTISIIFLILSSVGIYIGRFLRLHSIYLFTEPKKVIDLLLAMWDLKMLIFVFLMTLVQGVGFVCLQLTKRPSQNQ